MSSDAEQEPEPAREAVTSAAAERGDQQPTSAELTDRWRRAAADLDNLRKRYARELAREREAERARVAATLLPIVDNLDLALAHADADPATIVPGVRAVRDQT